MWLEIDSDMYVIVMYPYPTPEQVRYRNLSISSTRIEDLLPGDLLVFDLNRGNDLLVIEKSESGITLINLKNMSKFSWTMKYTNVLIKSMGFLLLRKEDN